MLDSLTASDVLAATARWTAALTQAGAEDANYGRWPHPVIPATLPDMPHHWFVEARQRAA